MNGYILDIYRYVQLSLFFHQFIYRFTPHHPCISYVMFICIYIYIHTYIHIGSLSSTSIVFGVVDMNVEEGDERTLNIYTVPDIADQEVNIYFCSHKTKTQHNKNKKN